ncbi:cytochrome P450 3A14-like isoform X3 [Mya arenaria]|uniref:cytochrome P450 3A14-like isoform X3 n=2 Tax=Mya arenaria TaxID=6604 RepID=UPI0022E0426C|nr:cytochrome P450 3A14-like isoform X3 [Mya arenaria]
MYILDLVNIPDWILVIVCLVGIICTYTRYKQSYFKRLGIPFKPPAFLIGDIPDIIKKGVFHYVDIELAKKHGKVFGLYTGNNPSLIICDPEIIKHITVKDFENFTNRAQTKRVPPIWQRMLTFARGETWRNLRHTLSPSFSVSKMKNMCPFIQNCLETLHEILNHKCEDEPNGFDLDKVLRAYTMDMICQTGFGFQVHPQTDPNHPFLKHAQEFFELKGAKSIWALIALLIPDIAETFPRLFTTRFVPKEDMDFFVSTMQTFITERRRTNETHNDFLQLMVNANFETDYPVNPPRSKRGLSEDEIIANCIMFMLGSYDTNTSVLDWMFYELAVHEDVQEQLIESIDKDIGKRTPTYEDVFSHQYLEMVLCEVLRMHPANPRINREAAEDIEIQGLKIPQGMDCNYPPKILHFMEEYWDEPFTFNPERFSPENKHKINEYAFIPFGLGPRNCVAMRLGQLEVKMTIVSILQKYRVHRTNDLKVPMLPSPTGVNKLEGPLFVRMERRE